MQERLLLSNSERSRDGLILAVFESVIARIALALSYVCSLIRYQLKHATNGQNVIALILVIDDVVLPLDIRKVSKLGQGLKTKPEIFAEMIETAIDHY